MIEINLIPDIKAEFLRAQATKRVVVTISVLVSTVFLAVAILLWLYVSVVQGGNIASNDEEITELKERYVNLEDVSKILTLDRQLTVLPQIHNSLPAATRLPDYYAKLVPDDIKFSAAFTDFNAGLMTMAGTAKDIRTVNKFVDTLKNSVYAVQGGEEVRRVFNAVVLQEINSISGDSANDNQASFEILARFDSEIFNSVNEVVLTVPDTSSDEVELLKPEDLVSLDELIQVKPRTEDLFEEPPETEDTNEDQ